VWHDGRFRVAAFVVFALLVAALAAGAKHYAKVKQQHDAAQSETRQQWLAQKAKNPQSAAHYGIYVVKPMLGLARIRDQWARTPQAPALKAVANDRAIGATAHWMIGACNGILLSIH
jgi:hypothetical protein